MCCEGHITEPLSPNLPSLKEANRNLHHTALRFIKIIKHPIYHMKSILTKSFLNKLVLGFNTIISHPSTLSKAALWTRQYTSYNSRHTGYPVELPGSHMLRCSAEQPGGLPCSPHTCLCPPPCRLPLTSSSSLSLASYLGLNYFKSVLYI